MFERFIDSNDRLIVEEEADYDKIENNSYPNFLTLLEDAGSSSYANGLYRIHTGRSSLRWSIFIEKYFSNHVGKIVPFGYD